MNIELVPVTDYIKNHATKYQAAKALSISPQLLENWIMRGYFIHENNGKFKIFKRIR